MPGVRTLRLDGHGPPVVSRFEDQTAILGLPIRGRQHLAYHRHGSFYETFTLPQGGLSGQIDARYHSGVLEVHLPKSEECQAKRIAVKIG